MATLQLIPQSSSFPQDQPVSLVLRADYDDAALGTAILSLTIPGTGFANVVIAPAAFTPPAETFDVAFPAATPSHAGVQCHRDSGAAGPLDVLRIDAVVVGERSASYFVRAEVIDALDVNGAPLALLSTELEVIVDPGLPGIVTTELERGFAEVPYRHVLRAQGGRPPHTWSLASGTLPGTIALATDGTLSGTSLSPATATLDVRATDQDGQSATATLNLVIRHAPLRITTGELPPAAPGRNYSQTLGATGGKAPIHWTVDGLPPGLHVQINRISGSPDHDPSLLGRMPLVLHASDADDPPQTASAAVDLLLLPALPRQNLTVASPGTVVVGRDLCWIDYQVTTHGTSERLDLVSNVQAELERDRDALIAEIAELAAETLEVNDPSIRRIHHESLSRIIDSYRDLGARKNSRVTIELTVAVDDQTIATAHSGGQRTIHELRANADHPRLPYDQPRSTRGKHVRAAFARGGGKLRAWARGVLDAAFDDHASRRRHGPHDARPRYMFGAGLNDYGVGSVFESLSSVIPSLEDFGFDIGRWFGDLIPKPGVVRLTPGKHRVSIRWVGGEIAGPFGILIGVGRRDEIVRFSATFQPLHAPTGPRFAAPTVFSGNKIGMPGAKDYDAVLSQSGIDIVVSTGDGLKIFTDTGKTNQRYQGAVPYEVQPGFTPERITAAVVDPYGRTSLLMHSASQAAFIINQGSTGPQLLSPALNPSPVERIGDATPGPVETSGWRRVHLSIGSRLATFQGLASVRTAGTLSPPTFTPLPSGITFDVASCLALLEPDDEQEPQLAVGFDAAGQIAIISEAAPLVPPGRFQQPVDLVAGNLTGGGFEIAAALRQARAVHLFRWQSGWWQPLTSVHLPLRPWELTTGPMDSGCLAVASRRFGSLLLVVWIDPGHEPRILHLVSGRSGLRISGCEGTLAVTDPAAGKVTVYR